MSVRHIFAAALIGIAGSTAARADSFNFPSFNGSSPITYNGTAALSGNKIALTPYLAQKAGAAYASNAFAFGPGSGFQTSFTFNMNASTTTANANGFAFFITSNASGIGTSDLVGGLGLTGSNSIAVEFRDITSGIVGGVGNGPAGNNFVSVITDGNAGAPQGGIIPYGATGCLGSAATNTTGCLANGHLWTATVAYASGLLNVTIQDGAGAVESFAVAVGDLAAKFGSSVKFGFSATTGKSTGGGTLYDQAFIDSWSLSVPEPMTLALFGTGLVALGVARRRRAI